MGDIGDKDMVLRSIRGATTTENDATSIQADVCAMCQGIFSRNKIATTDIVNIQFTVTGDIDALNPATALRRGAVLEGISRVPLFCAQEPYVVGGLKKAIRVMVTCYMERDARVYHCYLKGASGLRPDFNNRQDTTQ